MHSNNNSISEDELEDAFLIMKELLQDAMFKNLQECKDAVEELDKLKKKNIICDIDESSEIWKLAKDMKEAVEEADDIEEPEPSSEAITILLRETLHEVESELKKTKNDLEDTKTELKATQTELKDTKNKYETVVKDLKVENEKLQKEINAVAEYTPSFAGRVAKGTAAGTGVGIFGGPVGALVGATAGGAVGGISYYWDKITK
ncbi:uncharacterized protein LOC132723620 [Ruditapes philippinarum]|uniref:uncharacterized protein LOC132723620 n=1 Tax=Ruditapes philippinarum TaxID=129788 RepID=UPI00295C2845|nr:uncharacterized protein LOC132723620 [Ruditapes philippinarum]